MKKKITYLLLISLILTFVFGITISAHYNGVKDQHNYNVPKVNPLNSKINFDGTVDLDGEWAGALNVTFDISKENTELTVWDANVWDASIPALASTWSDIPESSRITWDYYFMWDDDGLYIGVVCENDPTNPGVLDVAAYRGDSYDGNLMTDRHAFEIVPSDDFAGLNNSAGNMYWYYFWSETDVQNFWLEGQTMSWNSYDTDPEGLGVKVNGKRNATANAQGYYPYNMEIFIPWDGLKYDTSGKLGQWDFTAAEGWTFMMGMIAEDRTGNTAEQIRVTNGSGWWNFDFFTLTEAVPVVISEVIIVDSEEPGDTTEASAPATTATTTTPATAPQTSDPIAIAVLFMAVTSVSALVLKKKSVR